MISIVLINGFFVADRMLLPIDMTARKELRFIHLTESKSAHPIPYPPRTQEFSPIQPPNPSSKPAPGMGLVAYDVLLNMSELTPYLRERLEESKRDLAQQKDWYAELSNNELVQINGLVSLSYPHGDSFTELDEWSVVFTFDGWTDSEGKFWEEELVIRKVVQKGESDSIKELVQPRGIIAISCHIGVIKDIDRKDAALVSIIDSAATDERLEEYKAELEEPVVLSTGAFGELKLDREVGWFEGEARWGLRNIRINLSPADISEPSSVIARAENLWRQRKTLTRQACELAAATLLEVKNSSWLNEGERPMTEAQFIRKMKLESITVEDGEGYNFWFEDGDIFWGHSIEVRGEQERGFFDAGFHG